MCSFNCPYGSWQKLVRMLKLRKIAITGSLAAGKSTVCLTLKKLGAYVFDSDKIAHTLLDSVCLRKKLKKILGEKVIKQGKTDRKAVADIVFNSSQKLLLLEKLIHPQVLKKIKEKYNRAQKNQKYRLFVVELPLLFELQLEKKFDWTVFVAASQKIRRKRFKQADFLKREKRFLPVKKALKKADFVIKNNRDLNFLKKQTINLYSHLTQKENI